MSPEGVEPVFKKQLLGEILLERKLITPEQLKTALKVQEKEEGFLGEILVKLGFSEELDIVMALVVQGNLPYLAVDQYDIDPRVLQLIPKDVACKNCVVPLDVVGPILSVVMVNPLNQGLIAELARLTNYTISPFIATKAQVERALTRWYKDEK